jgi:hypothetical protein
VSDPKVCICGKAYTHAQRWWHEKCQSVANVVVDAPSVANTVANEKYARYRDKGARREYMRELMRRKRKAKPVVAT